MADSVLVVFAKEPRAGEVKTRLCPPLSAEQAALCHRAFTSDLTRRLADLDGVRRCLAATPRGAAPWLTELAGRRGMELVWQRGRDLGRRMRRVVERETARGNAVIVLGSDAPDVPLSLIRRAITVLAEPSQAGVVVGPSVDGGYYLIGSRGPVPPIFELQARWGSDQVLGETLARLQGAELPFEILPAWHDVDDHAGLRRLSDRVRRDGAIGGLRDTGIVLERLAGEGVPL